jgi:FkbM family methyltransferase
MFLKWLAIIIIGKKLNTNKVPSIKKTIFIDYVFSTFTNDWMGMDIINGKNWEPHITEFLKTNLNENSTFIDVGSAYGWHSIHSSKLCKKILSFEPQGILYNIQKQNIDDNCIKNIDLYNIGIGDSNKTKFMTPINYENNSLNYGDLSVSSCDNENGEKIVIKKLDSFRLKNVDIVKIDVQGYEKYVLLGLKDLIKTQKPSFIIEIESHQLRKFDCTPNEIYDLFKEYDYHIFLLDYHYPSDFACIHKDKLTSFRDKNKNYIFELTESNNINYCLENGVNERIYYNHSIKYNSTKLNTVK